MKISIQVFLKKDELDKLGLICRKYDLIGYVLTDTLYLVRSDEYMYTFEERREVR